MLPENMRRLNPVLTFLPGFLMLDERTVIDSLRDKLQSRRCLVGIDVSDAFQHSGSGGGQVVYKPVDGGPPVYFALGKVLLGQRERSEKWYVSLTEFLGSSLNIEALESYPTLLRAPQDSSMLTTSLAAQPANMRMKP